MLHTIISRDIVWRIFLCIRYSTIIWTYFYCLHNNVKYKYFVRIFFFCACRFAWHSPRPMFQLSTHMWTLTFHRRLWPFDKNCLLFWQMLNNMYLLVPSNRLKLLFCSLVILRVNFSFPFRTTPFLCSMLLDGLFELNYNKLLSLWTVFWEFAIECWTWEIRRSGEMCCRDWIKFRTCHNPSLPSLTPLNPLSTRLKKAK